MKKLATVLFVLGVGGYLLPLFGLQFRLVTGIVQLAPAWRICVPGAFILAAIGLAALSAFMPDMPATRPQYRARQASLRDFFAQRDQSIMRSVAASMPTEEEIVRHAVPGLPKDAIHRIYPFCAEIMFHVAKHPFDTRIFHRIALKARVTANDAERFSLTVNIVDYIRRGVISEDAGHS